MNHCFYCGRIKDKNESSTSVCPVCNVSLGMGNIEESNPEFFKKAIENRKKNTQYNYVSDCMINDSEVFIPISIIENIEKNLKDKVKKGGKIK